MAENRNYYTAPDVVERAIRACWPELNFRLREQIGHGGMSDVYKLSAGGRVEALKVTNSARADTPELCEDLRWRGANEVEYARRMSEAGCGVKVYDTAEFVLSDSDSNHRLFLIRMEYLQSQKTSRKWKKKRRCTGISSRKTFLQKTAVHRRSFF